MQSLEEIRRRDEESKQLNQELGDTNRGVVALYAELDERAEQLRKASELKSRFLSHMSHEFRTPLNSVLALSRLLLDRIDGDLNAEQERQIGYIRRSAESLLELVNDLLDLSKVEAGKVEVKPAPFTVASLFGALRGALRPLLTSPSVELIFDAADDMPELMTDEAKVAQILRNLISNALKFTEKGEVHVAARYEAESSAAIFTVRDTGIGIAAGDHDRIFEEFSQIDTRLQKNVKGTGLGLPLSRSLARTDRRRHSRSRAFSGQGSVFTLTIPAIFGDPADAGVAAADSTRKRVLIIDDDETFRYVMKQIIRNEPRYEIIRGKRRRRRPAAGAQRASPTSSCSICRCRMSTALRFCRSSTPTSAPASFRSSSPPRWPSTPNLKARLPVGTRVDLQESDLARKRLAVPPRCDEFRKA